MPHFGGYPAVLYAQHLCRLRLYPRLRTGKVVPTILFGTVFNGIVVGAELSIVYGSPFLLNAVCVAAGEGVSLLLGAVLYKLVGKRVESIWR